MFSVYKITDAGNKPNSHDLMGLLIIKSDDGIFLVDPEPNPQFPPQVLSDGLIGIEGPPFFQFNMHFQEHHWQINCNTSSPELLTGRWHNRKHKEQEFPDDEDNWTAKGSGTGTGTGDDDDARAASATY